MRSALTIFAILSIAWLPACLSGGDDASSSATNVAHGGSNDDPNNPTNPNKPSGEGEGVPGWIVKPGWFVSIESIRVNKTETTVSVKAPANTVISDKTPLSELPIALLSVTEDQQKLFRGSTVDSIAYDPRDLIGKFFAKEDGSIDVVLEYNITANDERTLLMAFLDPKNHSNIFITHASTDKPTASTSEWQSNVTFDAFFRGPQVSAGSIHSCSLIDGAVKCWGANFKFQLGSSEIFGIPGRNNWTAEPQPVVGLESGVRSIESNGHRNCAILKNRTVKCWGGYLEGQIPLELPEEIAKLQNVRGISLGANHGCAVLEDGSVKCWGKNDFGQLGTGPKFDPIDGVIIGAEPLFSHTPLLVGGLLDGKSVSQVACGHNATCVLAEGKVYCWGDTNFFGNPEDSFYSPELNVYSPELNGPLLRNLNGKINAISMGKRHVCAVTDQGGVKCDGIFRPDYQLFHHNEGEVALNEEGFVIGLENNSGVTSISSSPQADYSCGIQGEEGIVKCWGGFSADEIISGDSGDSVFRVRPAIQVPGISKILYVTIGSHHTCATKLNEEIICWDDGNQAYYFGELGPLRIFDAITIDLRPPE